MLSFARVFTTLVSRVNIIFTFESAIVLIVPQGNKMVFLALRQQISTIQAIVQVNPNTISKQMVKWAAGLDSESIVVVEGKVQKPQVPVESTTVSDAEILVEKVKSHTTPSTSHVKLIRNCAIDLPRFRYRHQAFTVHARGRFANSERVRAERC